MAEPSNGKGRLESMAASGPVMSLLERLNDLIHMPVIEDFTWYGFYAFLLATAPFWLCCLALLAVWDLFSCHLLRTHASLSPADKGAVLITGAGRGYCLRMAKQLVKEGWTVYAGAMTEEGHQELKRLAKALETLAVLGEGPVEGRLVPLFLDPRDPATIEAAAARIATDVPDKGLHAVINGASGMVSGAIEWLKTQDFDDVMKLNYSGTVAVTLAMLPLLKKGAPGSRVINITSSLGVFPGVPLLAPFTAACQATQAFTAALRHELRPHGIFVCALSAGLNYSPQDVVGHDMEESLLQRWGQLDDKSKEFYGPDYAQGALGAIRGLTVESCLHSRHVLKSIRHAVTAVQPRPQYLVGMDAKFNKNFLRILPPRLGDGLVSWVMGDSVVPAQLLKERQGAVRYSTEATDEDDDANGNNNGEDEGEALRKCRQLYEVQDTLGEGAFAVVKLGVEKKTRQKVALKIIRKRAMQTAKALQNLKQEMQILERLQPLHHPHLVGYVGQLEDRSGIIMILEFCPGGDLFDHVVKQGHYSMRDASVTARQILLGLKAMHAQGVIHRDLKPENCIYGTHPATGRPVLKLADFGLAIFCKGGSSVKAGLAGTPAYMAPEVIRSRDYSEKCDVWAVGVILFILLAGWPPFAGRTHKEIFEQIKSGKWGFYGEQWRAISEQAKDCVSKLLTMDWRRRLSVSEALNHPFLAAETSMQIPDTPLPEAFESFRRFTLRSRFKAVARLCIVANHAKQMRASNKNNKDNQQSEAEQEEEALVRLGGLVCGGRGVVTEEEMEQLKHEWVDAMQEQAQLKGHVGGLELEGFKRVMKQLGKDHLPVAQLFKLFDTDRSGRIELDEIVRGLRRFQAQGVEALEFLFEVLDEDGSGSISRDELAKVLIHHRQRYMQQRLTAYLEQGDASEGADSSGGPGGLPLDKAVDLDPEAYELSENIADFFLAFDADGDGEVTKEEFLAGARTRPDLVALLVGGKQAAQKEVMLQQSSRRQGHAANLRPAR